MSSYPSGTVTFLFTDIEGSTKLAQAHPEQWESMRAQHHAILRSAIESRHGYVFQIIGDAFCAAFHTAMDGLNAALEAQRRLQAGEWSGAAVKVRMGLHTGSAELQETDYRGYLTLAKVQRVMSVAYGGQVLLSNACAELLHNELPGGITLCDMHEHQLKGLPAPERLWQMVAPGLQRNFLPLQSRKETPNNLPVQLSSFIGREKEVDQVRKRLEKNHLVSLTGSGGVGKTRLSIQVASQLLDEYPKGVWLVELAPITDPSLVPLTVCAALEITLQGNAPALDVLMDYLRPRKVLLVVDNCEHLIDASAQLCEALLHACPELRILASSREALGIEGETAYRVPSLSLPQPNDGTRTIEESEAVKLFLERAKAVLPEFEMTEANAPVVAQVCRRLDGIALAIELAASRVKVLKLEQIAARLDDAFRLLTGGSRTALPRQQTLRAMIDWSYNLLSDKERKVLRELSVFMGGWTLEGAESVCENPDMLDLLSHLVDKSLVAVDLEHGDEPRYYLLETVRQYAREKLAESGEGEVVRERHTRWYAELAERAEPKLNGHGQLEWLERMEQELDNLRTALEWSLHNNHDLGFRITSALMRFWDIHDHEIECLQYLEKLFQTDLLEPSWLHARALACASWVAISPITGEKMMAYAEAGAAMSRKTGNLESLALSIAVSAIKVHWQGEEDRAYHLFEESLALYEEAGVGFGRWAVLSGMGYTSQALGNHERARAEFQQSLALSRENGDIEFSHFVLNCLGALSFELGHYEQALNYYQESLSIARQVKHKSNEVQLLQDLGDIHILLGQYDQAKNLMEESIMIEQDASFRWEPARVFERLGWVARLQGDYEQAGNHYANGLRLAQKYNLRRWLARCLAGLAELAGLSNRPEKAAQLFGAADAIPEFKLNLWPNDRLELEQISETIRNQPDEATYSAAYEAGKRMSLDEAVACALQDLEP